MLLVAVRGMQILWAQLAAQVVRLVRCSWGSEAGRRSSRVMFLVCMSESHRR